MGLSRAELARTISDDLASAADIAHLYPEGGGAFFLNGKELPLARMTPADNATWDAPTVFSELESAPYWASGRPAMASTDPRVDHTGNQTSVKDQFDRLTCASFATLAAMEAILKARGTTTDLSEQHVNTVVDGDQCRDVVETAQVAAVLRQRPICTEDRYPYEDRIEVTRHDCLQIPPQEAVNGARHSVGGFREIPNLGLAGPSIANTAYLESLLFHGHDIVFETEVAYEPRGRGIQDVRRNPIGSGVFRTGNKHAMLMVGYDRTGALPFFICKNSYGTGFGQNGYFLLSYRYIRTYAIRGVIIESVNVQ